MITVFGHPGSARQELAFAQTVSRPGKISWGGRNHFGLPETMIKAGIRWQGEICPAIAVSLRTDSGAVSQP